MMELVLTLFSDQKCVQLVKLWESQKHLAKHMQRVRLQHLVRCRFQAPYSYHFQRETKKQHSIQQKF